MKTFYNTVLVVTLLLTTYFTQAQLPIQLIVKSQTPLQFDKTTQTAQELVQRADKNGSTLTVLNFTDSASMMQAYTTLSQTKAVDFVEMNASIAVQGGQVEKTNDGQFFKQWALENNGDLPMATSKKGADIEMNAAWAIETGDSNIVVAIIDTGVKLDHPEFEGRIWTNHQEVPNNGKDDDGNGFVDDVQGWDFTGNDNNPTDDSGHGTNIASIIGANGNNGFGFSGMDWNCKLMVLKVLKGDLGQYDWLIKAIYYAVDNGADVLNLSVGGKVESLALNEAIQYALDRDVTVVVSMGNEKTDQVSYPSNYPGVIAVGSTNPDDNRTAAFFWGTKSGSNYGEHISVVAPGNYIYGLSYTSNTGFNNYYGGTSQATAYVSGLASLLKAQKLDRTPADIKSLIERTAEDQVGTDGDDQAGWDKYYGHGRINAFHALELEDPNPHFELSTDEIEVYPNPNNGNFTVEFPAETERVELVNNLGVVLQTVEVSNQLVTRIQATETGIFLVRIFAKGQSAAKLVTVTM